MWNEQMKLARRCRGTKVQIGVHLLDLVTVLVNVVSCEFDKRAAC